MNLKYGLEFSLMGGRYLFLCSKSVVIEKDNSYPL